MSSDLPVSTLDLLVLNHQEAVNIRSLSYSFFFFIPQKFISIICGRSAVLSAETWEGPGNKNSRGTSILGQGEEQCTIMLTDLKTNTSYSHVS